jgi:hypothetical protein
MGFMSIGKIMLKMEGKHEYSRKRKRSNAV